MIIKTVLHDMYLNKKLSVPQISSLLHMSEGSINYWLNKYEIKKRKIADAIYERHNPGGDPFKVPPFLRNNKFVKNKYFLAGLGFGLYWGEGNKRSLSSVRLGNTDYKLVLKFLEFLENIFTIKRSKLRFGLQIFSDMTEKEAMKFWCTNLNVSQDKFNKTVITKSGKLGNYKHKSKEGVLSVYFHNTKLRNFIVEKIANL